MALSILDSDVIYRYELEVFIDHMLIKKLTKDPDRKRTDEEAPIPKYIFRLTLNGILKTDISSADEPKESLEGQLPSYYDDVKENNSLIDIKRQLEKRYDVDENPVCDWPTLFYNISQKKNDKGFRAVSKISINKGAVCIFACMPRTLIVEFLKNPIKVVVYEDLDDDQLKELGTMYVPLNASTGFTEAISYHFYEKGNDEYSHTDNNMYVADNTTGENQFDVKLSVSVKLTCHGLEERVDRLVLRSDVGSQLEPVYPDEKTFEISFDKLIIQPRTKMMYLDHAAQHGKEIEDVSKPRSGCPSVEEPSGSRSCSSPCCILIKRIKETFIDDKQQQYEAAPCKPDTARQTINNSRQSVEQKRSSLTETVPARRTLQSLYCFSPTASDKPVVKKECDHGSASVTAVVGQTTCNCNEYLADY